MMVIGKTSRTVLFALGGLLCVVALVVFASANPPTTRLESTADQANYVLDHERWYESADYWSATGWRHSELPQLSSNAIADRELSAYLSLLAATQQNNAQETFLVDCLGHRNETISRGALSKLIELGVWRKADAIEYARRQGWDVSRYDKRASQVEASASAMPSAVEPSGAKPDSRGLLQVSGKLAEAIYILDHPDWHESDPGIARIRASHARNPPNKRTPLDGNIRNREGVSIGVIISSDMPRDEKGLLLTSYLGHHNPSVSSRCFVALVTFGMWSAERATTYLEGHDSSVESWHKLLQCLPKGTSDAVKQDVSRRLLTSPSENQSAQMAGSPRYAEIDAARVLLGSHTERDYALIRSAVQRKPNSTMLWAAASRLPKDDATVRHARAIYGDTTKPLPVRCAAALVFAKDDHTVMRDVVGHILSNVREFGSEKHMKWVHSRSLVTDDPNEHERMLRAKEMEGFIAVAYEIPVQFLIGHVPEFVENPYMTLGTGVSTVLARRTPREFVAGVSNLNSVPRELFGPLVIAGRRQPDLADRAKRLIPTAEQQRFERSIKEEGPEIGGIRSLALWD